MMPGQSFSHTFDDSGVYDYYCIIHSWMKGTVTVSDDAVQTQSEPQVEEEVEESVTIPVDVTPIETDVINIASLAETASCDDTKTCVVPYHAQVTLNQNVTWSATSFERNIVSGNVMTGPDGLFNLGYNSGPNYFVFNQTGTFQFFDMVRPWIAGNVTVVGGN